MDIEQLRKDNLPNKIEVLFIAEAKPDTDERFFYYPQVDTKDYLYLGLIRALFDNAREISVKELRRRKPELLTRFKNKGYYLVDAVDEISSKMKSPERTKIIRANAANKIVEIHELLARYGDKNTKVVLIKATVFDGLYELMKDDFNVINDFKIPFPSNGHQAGFLEQISKVTKKLHL